jgi:hypothetical protein
MNNGPLTESTQKRKKPSKRTYPKSEEKWDVRQWQPSAVELKRWGVKTTPKMEEQASEHLGKIPAPVVNQERKEEHPQYLADFYTAPAIGMPSYLQPNNYLYMVRMQQMLDEQFRKRGVGSHYNLIPFLQEQQLRAPMQQQVFQAQLPIFEPSERKEPHTAPYVTPMPTSKIPAAVETLSHVADAHSSHQVHKEVLPSPIENQKNAKESPRKGRESPVDVLLNNLSKDDNDDFLNDLFSPEVFQNWLASLSPIKIPPKSHKVSPKKLSPVKEDTELAASPRSQLRRIKELQNEVQDWKEKCRLLASSSEVSTLEKTTISKTVEVISPVKRSSPFKLEEDHSAQATHIDKTTTTRKRIRKLNYGS